MCLPSNPNIPLPRDRPRAAAHAGVANRHAHWGGGGGAGKGAIGKQGSLDLLGGNLTYLLRIFQVVDHASLPPMWKALADAPKRQHLTTLQHAFDDTNRQLSIRAKSSQPQSSSR